MIAEGSGPAVLLLHGSGPGTTAAAWAPLISTLASRFRVVAPDLPGFGDAPAAPVADWAGVMLRLVDELGPCAVVGNSAGGALALHLAHARPRAVTRVIAVGTMGYPMPLPPGLDALWAADDARAVLELVFHDRAHVSADAVAARERAMREQPAYRELFPAPRQRWVDALSLRVADLAAITAPVLLIHGAQDRVVPLADSILPLLRTIPDVRAHVFGRCGHSSPLEHTDEFNRLVMTFVETDR